MRQEAALRERVFHTCAGVALDEVRRRLGPEADRVLTGNSDLCTVDGEESYEQARDRVLEFFTTLAARHPGRRVLVVGHGGPHHWLLERALGTELRGVRALRWDTGHFSRFRIGADGVSVDFVNRSPEDIARSPQPAKESP